MGNLFPKGKYRGIGLELYEMCMFSQDTPTLLRTLLGYTVRLSLMSLSPHERNQSLQWGTEKLPTLTQEHGAPGGLCQYCLQPGYFFTTQTHIACRVLRGEGWRDLNSTFQEQSHISVLPKC